MLSIEGHMIKKIILFFLLWRTILYVAVIIASNLIHKSQLASHMDVETDFKSTYPYLVWIWGNFDGDHYLGIANRGYFNYEYAFFPFFPYLISFIRNIFHIPLIITGQLISNLSTIFSLITMYFLSYLDKKKRVFSLILVIFFLWPTSFFNVAVYNDSLFLFFACLALYLMRRKLFLYASLCAALATLTRLNGLALIFPLFFEYISANKSLPAQWNRHNFVKNIKESLNLRKIYRSKIYTIILIPIAFFSYLLYIQKRFGSWHLVFSSMQVWNQDKIVLPLQVFWRYFKILVIHPSFQLGYLIAFFELISVLFYIFLLVYSIKKIRLSYWIFFLISVLIPSLTGTFQGMPRYGLHLYPFYLSLALLLKDARREYKFIFFLVSAVLLFVMLGLFISGYFVA